MSVDDVMLFEREEVCFVHNDEDFIYTFHRFDSGKITFKRVWPTAKAQEGEVIIYPAGQTTIANIAVIVLYKAAASGMTMKGFLPDVLRTILNLSVSKEALVNHLTKAIDSFSTGSSKIASIDNVMDFVEPYALWTKPKSTDETRSNPVSLNENPAPRTALLPLGTTDVGTQQSKIASPKSKTEPSISPSKSDTVPLTPVKTAASINSSTPKQSLPRLDVLKQPATRKRSLDEAAITAANGNKRDNNGPPQKKKPVSPKTSSILDTPTQPSLKKSSSPVKSSPKKSPSPIKPTKSVSSPISKNAASSSLSHIMKLYISKTDLAGIITTRKKGSSEATKGPPMHIDKLSTPSKTVVELAPIPRVSPTSTRMQNSDRAPPSPSPVNRTKTTENSIPANGSTATKISMPVVQNSQNATLTNPTPATTPIIRSPTAVRKIAPATQNPAQTNPSNPIPTSNLTVSSSAKITTMIVPATQNPVHGIATNPTSHSNGASKPSKYTPIMAPQSPVANNLAKPTSVSNPAARSPTTAQKMGMPVIQNPAQNNSLNPISPANTTVPQGELKNAKTPTGQSPAPTQNNSSSATTRNSGSLSPVTTTRQLRNDKSPLPTVRIISKNNPNPKQSQTPEIPQTNESGTNNPSNHVNELLKNGPCPSPSTPTRSRTNQPVSPTATQAAAPKQTQAPTPAQTPAPASSSNTTPGSQKSPVMPRKFIVKMSPNPSSPKQKIGSIPNGMPIADHNERDRTALVRVNVASEIMGNALSVSLLHSNDEFLAQELAIEEEHKNQRQKRLEIYINSLEEKKCKQDYADLESRYKKLEVQFKESEDGRKTSETKLTSEQNRARDLEINLKERETKCKSAEDELNKVKADHARELEQVKKDFTQKETSLVKSLADLTKDRDELRSILDSVTKMTSQFSRR